MLQYIVSTAMCFMGTGRYLGLVKWMAQACRYRKRNCFLSHRHSQSIDCLDHIKNAVNRIEEMLVVPAINSKREDNLIPIFFDKQP